MFSFLKKKKEPAVKICEDNQITAILTGDLKDISTVSDPVFAEKMMGDGIAILTTEDTVKVLSPANGSLTCVFPTNHAFGVTMNNGVELLVHIGINTVESNGAGFKSLGKKQGDDVLAGEPIVEVNVKELGQKYDMPIMMIVTNANGKTLSFPLDSKVNAKDVICTIE